MYHAHEIFGVGGAQLAMLDRADPQTPGVRAFAASSAATLEPPTSALRALTDPKGSAIFWLGAAAVLGLVLVTGQIRVQAALGSRVGRGR